MAIVTTISFWAWSSYTHHAWYPWCWHPAFMHGHKRAYCFFACPFASCMARCAANHRNHPWKMSLMVMLS